MHLFTGSLLFLTFITVEASFRHISVYSVKIVTIECPKFTNYNRTTHGIEWFGPGPAKVGGGHLNNLTIDDENGTISFQINETSAGWYTCVIYARNGSVSEIEDTKVDFHEISFQRLYKNNLIAAIIASTSFVLLVLLTWLVWSYRWRPSSDDADGKNDPESKSKSSKKPAIEHLVSKAKELTKNKRRKPGGSDVSWQTPRHVGYHNQISVESSDNESRFVTSNPTLATRSAEDLRPGPAPINGHPSQANVEVRPSVQTTRYDVPATRPSAADPPVVFTVHSTHVEEVTTTLSIPVENSGYRFQETDNGEQKSDDEDADYYI